MSALVQHPRAVELVERRKPRKKVERAVSHLIAILDELDTDPEAEPWLGATEASVIVPQWPRSSFDDRKQDAGDEPEVEDEHRDITAIGAGPRGCRGVRGSAVVGGGQEA